MMRRMLPVWVCCVLLVLSGCAYAGQQAIDPANKTVTNSTEPIVAIKPSDESDLVIGSFNQMPEYDPFGTSKKEALLTPYELITSRGLLAYEGEGQAVPSLASGFKVSHLQGKSVIEVTLRPDLVWSDGKPLTTDDVVFTYQTYARPNYYGVWRNQMYLVDGVSPYRSKVTQTITGISADKNKRVVRFTLAEDQIRFLDELTAPILPKHQLAGKSMDAIDQLSRTGALTGAGPYQAKQFLPKEWKLAANPYYYEGKPKIAAIRIRQTDAAEYLPEGDKTQLVHFGWVPPDLASKLSTNKHAAIMRSAGNGYHLLGFNLHSTAVKDRLIREALAEAVSVSELSQKVFYGFAEQVKSPLPATSFAYVEGQFPRYDLKAARRVLEKKGYTKQNPLPLTLIYPADSDVRKRTVDFLTQAWEKLPVKIEVKALLPDQFVAHLFGGSPTDLYLYAWRYPKNPADLYSLFHSGELVGELGLNASRYESRAADTLLEKSQHLLTAEEQKRVLANWQQQIWTDLPIYPLVEVQNPYYVARAQLKGLAETLGAQPFRNIHQWYLE